MTTPPAERRPFDPAWDPTATHAHTPRCYWDLHRGAWRCPTERPRPGSSRTRPRVPGPQDGPT